MKNLNKISYFILLAIFIFLIINIYFKDSIISFFPHILFNDIKINFCWLIFFIGTITLFLIILMLIRLSDLSDIFYISNIRRLFLKIYQVIIQFSPIALFSVFFYPGLCCSNIPYG